MKPMLPALVLALTFSQVAFSATEQKEKSEGKTTIKIEDAADKKNKVDGDIDLEVTNAKLRAESGSKSKFSGSLSASYNGGSLERPLDKNRPNITNDPVPPRVTMGGDMALRYRMDKNQSMTFGTGFSMQRPFHEAERGDISNPYLNYNYVGKVGAVQNVMSFGPTMTTNSDDRAIGSMGLLAIGNTMMYDFNGSKFSLGMAAEGWYQFFDKENEIVTVKGMGTFPAVAAQQDYSVAAYPLIEYAVSDRLQLRTVFRPWIFAHSRTREDEPWTFSKRPWTQSIGVGFAATRDVYLYPNFQFDWERWRRDDFNFGRKNTRSTSTVGMSATINMF